VPLSAYFYEGRITDVSTDGSVDYRGRPADKATVGRWKAVSFIMGMNLLESPSLSLFLIILFTSNGWKKISVDDRV
jgi:hypothetical protein